MTDIKDRERIEDKDFGTVLADQYLAYALSTIMSRSLPDVRDGLKPVHRRLLYAMRALKLDPNAGFKKCARIVGDVMGKFHPHGDQAIYDALVRLAQNFSQRYPLIDGQGNFGNIDGDGAAAMRYTEARLTTVAGFLMEAIDQETVGFRETYDGEDKEPVVLPAAFPNLLANGASGIAVGMATSIPPHNILELCKALLHLIKHPNTGMEKLVELIPGPDFPTGGMIVEPKETILESYRTGRGGFRLRASWQIEHGKRGSYQIIVHEMPYQVNKGRVVEKLVDLIQQRKLPLLADVHDESAEDIRLVIEPKNSRVDADQLMEHIFRLTDLEVRVPLNLNVLKADQRPGILNLREALQAFLDHRHEVLVHRSRYRSAQIDRRLEILDGFLIAYLNLDEIIRIIREEDHPKAVMMERYDLSDVQVEAILNMRLRALRRLEEIEIKKEHKALKAELKLLRALLKDESRRWQVITDEIKDLRKQFEKVPELSRRRSQFGDPPSQELASLESLVEREPITVICSEKGWVRAIKGHVQEGPDVRYKDGDRRRFWLHAETTDKLIIFATNGRFYTLAGDKLPGGRGQGEPIRLMLELGNEEDLVDMRIHQPGARLAVASTSGRGFVVAEDAIVAQTRGGKQVLNLPEGEEAAALSPLPPGADHVAVIGDNRKLTIFPLTELPEMTRGRGVVLQRYKEKGLSDIHCFVIQEGLTWRLTGGRERRETDLTPWLGKRGAAGRLPPKGFPRNLKFR